MVLKSCFQIFSGNNFSFSVILFQTHTISRNFEKHTGYPQLVVQYAFPCQLVKTAKIFTYDDIFECLGHAFPKTFTNFMFWTKFAKNISINSKCIKLDITIHFIVYELFHFFSISYWTVLCSVNNWKVYSCFCFFVLSFGFVFHQVFNTVCVFSHS